MKKIANFRSWRMHFDANRTVRIGESNAHGNVRGGIQFHHEIRERTILRRFLPERIDLLGRRTRGHVCRLLIV